MSEELRPDVACPKCGRRPAINLPPEERELARSQPATALKLRFTCQHCRHRYPIYAAAFWDAA